MQENPLVAKTQINFRTDDWLKGRLDDYSDLHGFKKERMMEALLFGAVVAQQVSPDEIFAWIQKLAHGVTTGEVIQPPAIKRAGASKPEKVRRNVRAAEKALADAKAKREAERGIGGEGESRSGA